MLGEKELRNLVSIGIELTTEKNKNKLLENMLRHALSTAECDAGTIYIYEKGALTFKLMKTLSQGVDKGANGEVIELPPVPLEEKNICAFSAIHKELINIPDVYTSDRFNFAGPMRYDAMTGYRTGSMIVIPMADGESELVGVMQLLNKHYDKDNCTFDEFDQDDEFVLTSLASMAAISISEKNYIEEVKGQMFSFVNAFAKAVESRTPYNGQHTKRVAVYSMIMADYISKMFNENKFSETFDEKRKEQLQLAATLHDIGKMIVPLEVMNKATRLDVNIEKVEARFELLQVLFERDFAMGTITEDEFKALEEYRAKNIENIRVINSKGFLPDEDIAVIADIAAHKYKGPVREFYYLTEEEKKCLSVRKGTLTDEERKIMESHVVMTEKILSDVQFNKNYSHVVDFAATHHEKLNGKGYPKGLTEKDLALESKILAVVDVFDALTATDRPYKKPMSREEAYRIMGFMVKDGEVDGELVEFLKQALLEVSEEEIEKLVESNF